MCLRVSKGPLRAEKDIVCYKVLNRTNRGLESRHNTVWNLGKIKRSRIDYKHGVIEAALHSYRTRAEARTAGHTGAMTRCIIPKGTTYYEGRHNGFERGYASTRLIAEKVIR